jgi:hypothetical protein
MGNLLISQDSAKGFIVVLFILAGGMESGASFG